MPGRDRWPHQRRRQGGNRALGRERQDLGKRPGTDRSSHSQRAGRGSTGSVRRTGLRRKGTPPPISQVCPGDYESIEEREQLPATAEVDKIAVSSVPSVFCKFLQLFTHPATLARKKLVHSMRI